MILKNIDDFHHVNKEKYIKLLKSSKKSKTQCRVDDDKIKQIDLYCLLKIKFGNPNGIQSFLRGNHSGNFIEWQYSITNGTIYIDINASTRFTEFMLYSDKNIIDEKKINKVEVNNLFANEIIKYQKEIKETKNNLEYWNIFINAYKRLNNTINYYIDEYRKIKLKEPKPIRSFTVSKRQAEIYNYQLKKFIDNTNKKKNFAFAIRVLTPVAAESLVNLLIYTLAKEEIKNDKRLLDSILRSQIDVRVKTLHLNCNGLNGPYNQDDDRLKNFLRLIDKRNDLLHGNVLPEKNTFDNIYFDGTIPITEYPTDLSVEFSKQNLFMLEEEKVEKDYNTLIEFKEYLLSNIKNEIHDQVEHIIDLSQLGWNKRTNRIGVLFDDVIMQTVGVNK
jgi:hypothetical protein